MQVVIIEYVCEDVKNRRWQFEKRFDERVRARTRSTRW